MRKKQSMWESGYLAGKHEEVRQFSETKTDVQEWILGFKTGCEEKEQFDIWKTLLSHSLREHPKELAFIHLVLKKKTGVIEYLHTI